MLRPKVIGVIPARIASTRFPEKVLTPILGKSLIQRTYEAACSASSLDEVVIAVDDARVKAHVEGFGARAVMTRPECESGTARVAEAIENHFPEAAIIVNIQADEPCLPAGIIDILVKDLLGNKEALMTTPVVKITDEEQLTNPSSPKVVFDQNGRALYFSRHPIPYAHKNQARAIYYRHVGLYCFRREALLKFVNLASSPLRETEDLEQLKMLEHGLPIHVSIVDYAGVEVNHPEDVQKVEEFLCQENTSLLPVG